MTWRGTRATLDLVWLRPTAALCALGETMPPGDCRGGLCPIDCLAAISANPRTRGRRIQYAPRSSRLNQQWVYGRPGCADFLHDALHGSRLIAFNDRFLAGRMAADGRELQRAWIANPFH